MTHLHKNYVKFNVTCIYATLHIAFFIFLNEHIKITDQLAMSFVYECNMNSVCESMHDKFVCQYKMNQSTPFYYSFIQTIFSHTCAAFWKVQQTCKCYAM